jgi:NADH:ubiquinone oxidoreductase subunit E
MKDNVMKTIRICVGSACHVNGSYKVVKALNQIIEERELGEEVELVGSFCMGKCTEGVAVECDDIIYAVSTENAKEIFEKIMGEK